MTKTELAIIFNRVLSGEVVQVEVRNHNGEKTLLDIDKVDVYSDIVVLKTPPQDIEFK